MPLQDAIKDIQARLKNNGYLNEQAISQGIVLRLLRELGWETYDPQSVSPEDPTGGGRIDFALYIQQNKPVVLIEVKKHGNLAGNKLEKANEQAFGYAVHRGVSFIIVTDGQEWHFYLPNAQGDYEERKVYNLDLVEREITESKERLQRYLSFNNIANGDAFNSARKDLESATKAREAKRNVPEAWKKLIEEKDDMLLDLLSEKVEALCGYRPDSWKVFSYLRGLKDSQIQSQPYSPPVKVRQARISQPTKEHRKSAKPPTTMRVIFPNGKEIYDKKAITIFIQAIRVIGYEKVRSLGMECEGFPLVSTEQHKPEYNKWKDTDDGYFIHIHCNTESKKKRLDEISNRLNLGLQVTIVPAN